MTDYQEGTPCEGYNEGGAWQDCERTGPHYHGSAWDAITEEARGERDPIGHLQRTYGIRYLSGADRAYAAGVNYFAPDAECEDGPQGIGHDWAPLNASEQECVRCDAWRAIRDDWYAPIACDSCQLFGEPAYSLNGGCVDDVCGCSVCERVRVERGE